ncbi:antibiotic biosynthesis monooxygenase family protein [Sphingomonas sp. ERG5]|uniref:antibiotic biosynthesis monooxygenase family protein n=1 Tax=Sphingomonas sp. ERG5 TaxID=1381597 RepID=UPI000ACA1E5E|nr:antibiotic biosynthesis monooxygenase [Sphingomonas sp. ERG5]
MQSSSNDSRIFRIDRFVVPIAAEAEFLATVAEINTVFDDMDGCLQRHVLRQQGTSGDAIYMTIVEWESAATIQMAREAADAKHKEMGLDPQEMFQRLQIMADLGNYAPVSGGASAPIRRMAP